MIITSIIAINNISVIDNYINKIINNYKYFNLDSEKNGYQ
jgi:hypothetical protein